MDILSLFLETGFWLATVRMASAPRMPQKRIRRWLDLDTEKCRKMSRKTKMLSTLRLFSMKYPVRNSSPASGPLKK